jgi:hypothetical protein
MNYVTQFDLGTVLPKNFYESKQFKQLQLNLETSKQSYFLTGKAGTGKSTFVEYFRLNTKKNVMILAYTGIVSIKCRGRTIHSFFGYPHHILKRKDCKILRNQNFLKSLNTLIIDEVSMVNPNLMDAIDKSLKVNRGNDLPFGGVQMLFVGDVFQLAPIAKDKEKEVLDRMYPEGNFFYNSKWFKILNPKRIEFERIFRQKDVDFIKKLENIRRNQITNEVLDFFNRRVVEKTEKKTNKDSSSYQEKLSKIKLKYPITFKNWKEVDDKNYQETNKEIKIIYPKAGKKWSKEEDDKLRSFLKNQKCIYQISAIFERKPSAVSSRIIKFEDESLNDLSNGLILLAPTNRRTYQVNHKRLNNLESPEFSYLGKVTGSFKSSDMMSEENLKLKVGAQIMLTKNDPSERWVNGTIGFVDKLEKDKIFLKVGRKVFQVEKATWEKFDYLLKDGKFEPKVIGKFEQYPIRLAWAATIHKCQGQTFEKAIIDFDSGSFAHGMTYVALSRVKSIDGLHLIRPIRFSDVIFDKRIYKFQESVELFH